MVKPYVKVICLNAYVYRRRQIVTRVDVVFCLTLRIIRSIMMLLTIVCLEKKSAIIGKQCFHFFIFHFGRNVSAGTRYYSSLLMALFFNFTGSQHLLYILSGLLSRVKRKTNRLACVNNILLCVTGS